MIAIRVLKLGSVSPETPRADVHLNIHKINSITEFILKYSQLITQPENLLKIGVVDVEIESETEIWLQRKEKNISDIISASNSVLKNGRPSYAYRKCFGLNDTLNDRWIFCQFQLSELYLVQSLKSSCHFSVNDQVIYYFEYRCTAKNPTTSYYSTVTW